MSDLHFIRNFIYVIGGFTQKTGEDTGMMRLWARLFRWRAMNRSHAFTFLMPREWNDEVSEMADLLERHAAREPRPCIAVAGYSWGAGHGAIRLAKALAKRGREIDILLLVDPVYRSRLPGIFRLLAFTRWLGIRIPPNVRVVGVWRQSNAGPRGTKIHVNDHVRTRIAFERDLSSAGLTHATIQYHGPLLAESFSLITQSLQ